MNVLVCGAGGFLGQHVVAALLDAGHRVRAVQRSTRLPPARAAHLETVTGDLLQPEFTRRMLDGMDGVIFSAGRTWQPGVSAAELHADNVNLVRVFLAALETRPKLRVAFTSSASTIGGSRRPVVLCESSGRGQLNEAALSPYDRAKLAAEELVLEAARCGQNIVVLNPGLMLGPAATGDVRLSSEFFLLWHLQGKTPLFVNGGHSLCDVREVARAHVAALTQGRAGERYILAGHNCSMQEIYGHLAALSGVRPPFPMSPRASRVISALAQLGARASRGRIVNPLDRDFVRSLALHYFVDSSKAREELRYVIPPLHGILASTLQSFRARELVKFEMPLAACWQEEHGNRQLLLAQLLRRHAFRESLWPRFERVMQTCLANHDLRALLDRLLAQSTWDAARGCFRWPKTADLKQAVKRLNLFFDNAYLSSNQFLDSVL
jgi:dihydroflavonol-4-reductase